MGQVQKRVLVGRDVVTGATRRIEFGETILSSSVAAEPVEVYLAPGWIDLQVNGFAGVDYNLPETSQEDIAQSIQAMCATGVTRMYPTVITGPPEDMSAALENLARARESAALGQVIDGFHVEGPHISPEDGARGAHPREWVRPPDLDEFHRWQDAARGGVRLVTVAPEWQGALTYIETLTARGVVVAIGHTNATADRIRDAVSAGATLSTHLGNATDLEAGRRSPCVLAQLEDARLSASFIVDGVHLPSSFLRMALGKKGIGQSLLVTDASTPAGAAPGRYSLGRQAIDLTSDHRVVLAGQDRLAGSGLRMDQAIRNVMRIAGVSLADAVTMATTNPARAGGVPGRSRGLIAGDRADFVVFRFDSDAQAIDVLETWVGGERAFRRPGL